MNTKVWQTLAVVAIASVVVAGSVQADSGTYTIFGTGTNGTQAVNAIDPNFTLVGSVPGFTGSQPGTSLVVTNAYNGISVNGNVNGTASYITPSGGTTATGAAAFYIYQEQFTLPANLTSATLDISFTGDDYISDIFLNGNNVYTGAHNASAYNSAVGTLDLASGFNSGLNTLDFVVPNGTGLSALDAGFSNATDTFTPGATPEPSTVAVYMIGSLALLGFIVRKKRIS